jgi:hypothetical protein
VLKKNISVEPGKCCIHSHGLLYILAAWVKLFAATRSKRKFNNPVSSDEKNSYERMCTGLMSVSSVSVPESS